MRASDRARKEPSGAPKSFSYTPKEESKSKKKELCVQKMDTETEVSTTKVMKFTRNFPEKKSTKLSGEEKLRFSNDFLHNYWTSFVGHAPADEGSYYQSDSTRVSLQQYNNN
jgi:hypothetical protein